MVTARWPVTPAPGPPIGRYSDPEEVAEVVEFLASERNTYTTGSVWSVKGGSG
jgi:NAD(P)-dependent dehydrogenase (short-subunit alcohol dehydrogenase family)